MCRSRPEVNMKDAIGELEFAVILISMFAADGYMLHCSMKNSLLRFLKKLPENSIIISDEVNARGRFTSC
jgi:hypothetical protein